MRREYAPLSDQQLTGINCYHRLLALLRFCDEYRITQLFDGKIVEKTVELVQVTLNALLDNPEDMSENELQLTLLPYLDPDSSCGATSNRLALIFLAHENNRTKSTPYLSLQAQTEFCRHMTNSDFPVLLRIEISKSADSVKFTGGHSLSVLIINQSRLFVLPSYIGQYSLSEWLLSPKFQTYSNAVNTLSVHELLQNLQKLHSSKESDKLEAYKLLFGVPNKPSSLFCPAEHYKVECRLDTFDPLSAMHRLNALDASIHDQLQRAPDLAVYGFTSALSKRIFFAMRPDHPGRLGALVVAQDSLQPVSVTVNV